MTQGYIGVPMKEGKPQWTKDVLSPGFWSALGKAEGWKPTGLFRTCLCKETHGAHEVGQWEMKWHRFIDHLIEGKNADSFFKGLLE